MKPGCNRAFLFLLLLLRIYQALVLLRAHYVAGLDRQRHRWRVVVLRLIHLFSFVEAPQSC